MQFLNTYSYTDGFYKHNNTNSTKRAGLCRLHMRTPLDIARQKQA